MEQRIERDSLGEVAVPVNVHWGAQTQRSLINFPFGPRETMPLDIIHALARIKQAAAHVNRRHGLAPELSDAIATSAREVAEGLHDDQFPLAIWQTGSGTQSNMNVNEVIASRANEILTGKRGGKSPVHPNDHVNQHQSSNDSFPTALHIATALAVEQRLIPALDLMHARLADASREWADIVKIGRTHLQDATPITLGQEFSGYASQLTKCRARITATIAADILPLAQGGTAVGTGLNAPPGFADEMAKALSGLTGLRLRPADNPFEALASNDPLAQFAATLGTLAVALTKIANDIRLLGSGPRLGLGELELPANEPGSSIMPGKINPTQCEMLTMVCAQVLGNQQAVAMGAMQGHLELNVFKPMIGAAVLRSIDLLAIGIDGFTRHCLEGLAPNRARIAELLGQSLMLVTALVPAIGYDQAARIALHAHETGMTLRDAAVASGAITGSEFDDLVRPEQMI
ncbi:MAG: class II fumarate hydratase [Novosphingobium sp.]